MDPRRAYLALAGGAHRHAERRTKILGRRRSRSGSVSNVALFLSWLRSVAPVTDMVCVAAEGAASADEVCEN